MGWWVGGGGVNRTDQEVPLHPEHPHMKNRFTPYKHFSEFYFVIVMKQEVREEMNKIKQMVSDV